MPGDVHILMETVVIVRISVLEVWQIKGCVKNIYVLQTEKNNIGSSDRSSLHWQHGDTVTLKGKHEVAEIMCVEKL